MNERVAQLLLTNTEVRNDANNFQRLQTFSSERSATGAARDGRLPLVERRQPPIDGATVRTCFAPCD